MILALLGVTFGLYLLLLGFVSVLWVKDLD